MKLLKVLIVALLVTVGVQSATAQKLTVGVVDLQTIVKELPQAQEVDKAIKEMAKRYQDSLMSMQTDLETRFKDYQKQKAMMTPDQQQQTEQELQALNQQILQFQQMKFGQNGEVQQTQMKMLEPLRAKIKDAIDDVAKAEGLTLILDKSTETVLFSDDKFDITFKILDTLKRGKK